MGEQEEVLDDQESPPGAFAVNSRGEWIRDKARLTRVDEAMEDYFVVDNASTVGQHTTSASAATESAESTTNFQEGLKTMW